MLTRYLAAIKMYTASYKKRQLEMRDGAALSISAEASIQYQRASKPTKLDNSKIINFLGPHFLQWFESTAKDSSVPDSLPSSKICRRDGDSRDHQFGKTRGSHIRIVRPNHLAVVCSTFLTPHYFDATKCDSVGIHYVKGVMWPVHSW